MPKEPEQKELNSKGAIRLERLFIDRCKENLQTVQDIPNPLNKETLRQHFAEEYYEPHTLRSRVKEIMEENEIYDKPLVEKVPRGRYLHYTVYEHGIFDKKPAVMISAFVKCELADFVKNGKSSTPTAAADIETARLDAMKEPDLFHYIGIFGLCGFTKEACSLPLSGPNWELALVKHVDGTAWRIISGEPLRHKTMLALFDPEKKSEKLWRAKNLIESSPELTVSGGFVILSDIVENSGLSPEIIKKAAQEFCAQDKSVGLERVEGKLIIKRSRV